MQPRFNITDLRGRVVYTNLLRTAHGYDWGDGYGSIADALIKTEGWQVVPVRGPNSFTADGWRLMSPDTKQALGAMVEHVLTRKS